MTVAADLNWPIAGVFHQQSSNAPSDVRLDVFRFDEVFTWVHQYHLASADYEDQKSSGTETATGRAGLAPTGLPLSLCNLHNLRIVVQSALPNAEKKCSPRQQYLDLLGREPDHEGLDYWSAQLRNCGADAECSSLKRVDVSAAFFVEREFQDTGFFIYRLYKASLGTTPDYSQYVSDRVALDAGPNLGVNSQLLADSFVGRPDFQNQYPTRISNHDFVSRLCDSAGLLGPLDRQRILDGLNNGGTRGWA
jgi:hypothetical protein